MQNSTTRKRILKGIELAVLALLCIATVVLDFFEIPFSKEEFYNRMFTKILQQALGSSLALWLIWRLRICLFGRVENWLYLLPCLLVALDNFQWSAFINSEMQLVRKGSGDFFLFFIYCLSVGLFEELIFRGVLFSLLACNFSQDKKGFLKTYILSSVLFGASHLFNGFSMGTFLQVGYTCLTGGLFAFCLIKTKNILCCAVVHGVYNFCGLLFDVQGLGTGVVFDVGTVITMLVVSIAVGIFILYKVWNYTDEERGRLYARLGVPQKDEK